ncbi:MAG: AMP-binding protein [SAR324 cluster bacterium]|nr:AMP-binding protein [SAR324 cluster bacterium]
MTSATAPSSAGTGEFGTFPLLFERNAKHYGHKKIAIREKDLGIWQSYSWQTSYDQIQELANGLAALGLERGDKLAVIGDNRPHLYWAMLAAQTLGGIPVPLYQDSIEEEMRFIIDHAEARFAVVEDQEQVDKLIQLKESGSKLDFIVYEDPRGLRNYPQPYLLSYAALREKGRAYALQNPDYVKQEARKGQPDDLAVICYTSGTTGQPKGVMLTYRNFIETSRLVLEFEHLTDKEEVMAYLPMAWVGDFFLSIALALVGGFTVNCPENGNTVMANMREIGPTYFFAPPRIWENILTSVMIRMDEAAWIKRKLFHYFLAVADRVQNRRANGGVAGLIDPLMYQLGRVLVYGPLKDILGLGHMRIAYTAGEAIGPELFTFFRSLGVNLKQIYGQTEASVFVSMQTDHDVRSDTCGPPVPWAEIRFTEVGEVLYRSPGVFKGYYKDEQATAETLEDGWVHTGDAGFLDHDGHLKIIDRIKDVGKLQDGSLFAPKYVENKLKFSPFIREAMAVGRDRPHATALVNIDLEAVGNWAEKRDIMYTSYTDLAQKPEVYELIRDEVERVNRSLAQDEELKGAQIRRFLILHKELDPDDQEITRTRKLRRGFIEKKYASLVEALYSGQESIHVEAQVTFEDGRTSAIHADVKIEDVQPAA